MGEKGNCTGCVKRIFRKNLARIEDVVNFLATIDFKDAHDFH